MVVPSFISINKVNLGNMYAQGLGVEKNLEQARHYYQLAAPNNKNAQLLLEELDIDEKKKTEEEEHQNKI